MRSAQTTTPLRVLIAGGDIAALEAMLTLRRLAGGRVAIRLVAPQRDFTYRPLAIAEPFGLGRVHRFDLTALAARAGAGLVPSRVVGVEHERHQALTDDGGTLAYDALLVASAARPLVALPGAITYWGVDGGADIAKLLAELERGGVQRVAFAIHADVGWALPVYELALLTHAYLRRAGAEGCPLVVVTHEAAPLEMLGPEASRRVRALLAARGIDFLASRHPTAVGEGALHTVAAEPVPADRVVTLPRLEGPRLAGLPADERGFIPVDGHGRVSGAADVYAAGEATSFPIKSDSLTSEHANTVATAIAAAVGAPVDAHPFRPVLRGRLLTGDHAAELRIADDGSSTVAAEALWWPPDGVGGRHLAAHLAQVAGEGLAPPEPPADGRTTAVEVELSAAA